jgi:hypothetical protein
MMGLFSVFFTGLLSSCVRHGDDVLVFVIVYPSLDLPFSLWPSPSRLYPY